MRGGDGAQVRRPADKYAHLGFRVLVGLLPFRVLQSVSYARLVYVGDTCAKHLVPAAQLVHLPFQLAAALRQAVEQSVEMQACIRSNSSR